MKLGKSHSPAICLQVTKCYHRSCALHFQTGGTLHNLQPVGDSDSAHLLPTRQYHLATRRFLYETSDSAITPSPHYIVQSATRCFVNAAFSSLSPCYRRLCRCYPRMHGGGRTFFTVRSSTRRHLLGYIQRHQYGSGTMQDYRRFSATAYNVSRFSRSI